MKAITKSLLALLFVAAVGLVNLNAKDVYPSTTISEEITELMQNVVLPDGSDYFHANVTFVVNQDKEIVVVSVDTEDDFIESIIKTRLNYKKVDAEKVAVNKISTVKVTLRQP